VIVDRFEENVARHPDKVAVAIGGAEFSYRDLGEWVGHAAGALVRHDVRHGDHVAVLMDNRIEFVALLLAALRVGAVLVPFSPQMSERQLAVGFAKADVRHAVADRDVGLVATIPVAALGDGHPGGDAVPGALDDDYIVVPTSGSTSEPKPIVLTQAVKLARIRHTIETYALDHDDVLIVSTPMYHSLAQRFVLLPLFLGATVVILEKFTVKHYLDAIARYRVTFSMAVSNQLEAIIGDLDGRDLSSLRTVVSSSYALRPATKLVLLGRLAAELYECYGTSEIGCCTNLALRSCGDKAESVGTALPYVKVRILDDEFRDADGIGEIAVSTATRFKGYYGQPEATKAAYCGEYFLTGDLGRLDDDGFLYYLGRKKEIIKTGAISVYPVDIEKVILEVDGVRECAVVGVDDAYLGEVVVAVVVGDMEMAEVRRACTRELAPFQRPMHYEQSEALPKNSMGKVQKFVLSERLQTLRIGERLKGLIT